MILADDILAAAGGPDDLGGMIASIAGSIRQAERMVLADDVAEAGYQLIQSRPASMLEALPLCRFPYERLWLEWNGDASRRAGWALDPWIERQKPVAERTPRHTPLRIGCLIESEPGGQRGARTWAWQHRNRAISVGGVGVMFDYSAGGDVFQWGLSKLEDPRQKEMLAALARPLEDDRLTELMTEGKRAWSKIAGDERERTALRALGRHHTHWISPHAHGAIALLEQGDPIVGRRLFEGWMGDISGEAPFIDAVMIMLNSRNALEREEQDLTRLNRARVKANRTPFLSHSVTRLHLSKARQRDALASGMSRADMRSHLVRGHFKIRRTGVYWWSPFVRGRGAAAPRAHYRVEA